MVGSLTELSNQSENLLEPAFGHYDEGKPSSNKVDVTTTIYFRQESFFLWKVLPNMRGKKIHLKSAHPDPKHWECTYVNGCTKT